MTVNRVTIPGEPMGTNQMWRSVEGKEPQIALFQEADLRAA